ncbi:hypothetical protein M514_10821 [Trichuris suis]|uniref:Uncharacterized protein n=1 Tax=Trichuris suis TaxID=68888 RepID=A0A085LTN3_9BILA|nr:hypothetical protein M513_10821 [Trichuris suis]KFD64490.1 hypothetical protein M514_10821 [Trichuris suis]
MRSFWVQDDWPQPIDRGDDWPQGRLTAGTIDRSRLAARTIDRRQFAAAERKVFCFFSLLFNFPVFAVIPLSFRVQDDWPQLIGRGDD